MLRFALALALLLPRLSFGADCSALNRKIVEKRRAAADAAATWASYQDLVNAIREFDAAGCPDANKLFGEFKAAQEKATWMREGDEERRRQERQQADAHQLQEARVQRETAEAEAAERKERTLADPKLMAVIVGAGLCNAKETRTAALTEIAKERKYSRLAGVIDKKKLYDLQQQVRWSDETTRKLKERARASPPISPASCSAPSVQKVLSCLESCEDEDARYLASFVPQYSSDD